MKLHWGCIQRKKEENSRSLRENGIEYCAWIFHLGRFSHRERGSFFRVEAILKEVVQYSRGSRERRRRCARGHITLYYPACEAARELIQPQSAVCYFSHRSVRVRRLARARWITAPQLERACAFSLKRISYAKRYFLSRHRRKLLCMNVREEQRIPSLQQKSCHANCTSRIAVEGIISAHPSDL